MIERVIKRDGTIKPYDVQRIETAIIKAYSGCDEILTRDSAYDLIYTIENELYNLEMKEIHIEKVQDVIIEELERVNKKVSKAYKEYREQRDKIRESKMSLISGISGIVDMTNSDVILENSNKQSHLMSTQRDLIAGEVSKHYARSVLPKDILDAHYKGIIKQHDMDYYIHGMYNCCLCNIDEMLQNGTVINKKLIEKPKSLRTAMTIVTQICAQVASSQYGGNTISLAHIAPFVRISKDKIEEKYRAMNLPVSEERLQELILKELKDEIKDSVQTFNYQINTLQTSNGQSPFVSLAIYLSEKPEYKEEIVMLAEEFFNQRINGIKNEYGIATTQTFPKILYFLDEDNVREGSEYFELTKLAAKSTALRMNPDYISVKMMKEHIGHVFANMGCRSFLSPHIIDGKYQFYGRGNVGVCTLNIPYIALESKGDMDTFWELFDKYALLIKKSGILRYEKLKGVKANVAPILWQHGAISRLNADDDIYPEIVRKGFTTSFGYTGIYETVKYLTGESHTSEKGLKLAEEIMAKLRGYVDTWKKETGYNFGLYGTPSESSTEWFAKALLKEFGPIEGITNKGYITNSYHVDIQEEIDAFSKIDVESKLQRLSTGGAISYIETTDLTKNTEAVVQIIQYMYEKLIYGELNTESDACGVCGFQGKADFDFDKYEWKCAQCGNNDPHSLSIIRRTCGYLGETHWNHGRLMDINKRVKHI